MAHGGGFRHARGGDDDVISLKARLRIVPLAVPTGDAEADEPVLGPLRVALQAEAPGLMAA